MTSELTGKSLTWRRDSRTETYAALKLTIDNWRWAGVPFYIRTGKHLAARRTEIAIQFKTPPYSLFRDTAVEKIPPNLLRLQIDPYEGTATSFNAKVPGPKMHLGGVTTTFRYKDFFKEAPNVGYETLIYDCMIGDATLFQRADNIETSWAVVDPLLQAWTKGKPDLYGAGSAGARHRPTNFLPATDAAGWDSRGHDRVNARGRPVEHRGLRSDRRLHHRGSRGPQRLHRLAVLAPVR